MFKAIGNVLGSMFGGKEAGKSILGMVDMAFNTDQEKQDFRLEWAKATSTGRLARRVIGIGTMVVFFLMALVTFFMGIFLGLEHPSVNAAFTIAVGFDIPLYAGLVMAWYYASGAMRDNKK